MGGSLDKRETNDEIDARIHKVLSYIGERSEREVVLVGHSSWFDRMFQAHLSWDARKGDSWVQNAELRTIVIAYEVDADERERKKLKVRE
mmetsp:Transcript_818/g.1498  ORF Transcript_818/g.1498 Transcript_818/m.1498 type:complete len:90 (-) Transcript_818:51-320(-)